MLPTRSPILFSVYGHLFFYIETAGSFDIKYMFVLQFSFHCYTNLRSTFFVCIGSSAEGASNESVGGYSMKFDSIENALEVLVHGGLAIVTDDENRENEGDLMCIADLATPDNINFMITHGRGLVCMPMSPDLATKLNLSLMVKDNTELFQTAFTVSIDANPTYGVTTGVSAWDRAKTIQVALQKDAVPEDLVRPGHIFPLIAKSGGVFERNGHTEAATDLSRIAGYQPAGVIVEIINPDGTMARRDDLFAFKRKFNIPYITISDLRVYMEQYDKSTLNTFVIS